MSDYRIGQGFDVHPFAEKRRLILGGVEIPFNLGLAGNSDADVLAHAVGDALLGGAALGDLGQFYPDDDTKWKDADSLMILADISRRITEAGFKIINIDSTLILEAPRISPYRHRMIDNLALSLNISPDRVSLKATTTEKLGFTGRGEGIAAMAIALLAR
ncbi:2-C-methyl-D-erythritol 2,4-cyclodiphosphate synthase [bacterium]|nr:2-C-methyl-D-erythritol 2,4-cyclodiphosphate synthase [FCB group bacterium]MBL7190317.1 2-C-methyl-D-erythritol 2,4-cyclodiphosphate synthase [bacterium]